MVAFGLHLLCIIFCLLFQRNRLLAGSTLALMWLLFVTSNGLPDQQYYIVHFQNAAALSDKGLGYASVVALFNALGLGYPGFLFFVGTFYLGVVGLGAFKFTDRPALVMALVSIFPLCMEVDQLRNALAFSFVMVGFLVVYARKADVGGCVWYCVFCLIGGCIHIGVLPFLLFVVAYRCNIEQVVIVGVGVFLLGHILISLDGVSIFLNMLGLYERYGSQAPSFDLACTIRMAAPALCWILIAGLVNAQEKTKRLMPARWIASSNILILALTPLVSYEPSLFRIEGLQFAMAYLLAIAAMGKNDRTAIQDTFMLLLVALCGFALMLGGSITADVCVPFYLNNPIFNFL